MSNFDIVIRNGTVVDGSGRPSFGADVAIEGDRIVKIGEVKESGREEVDAKGRLVTPGFVDIHTHYDGQATWEHRLAPSSGHGVTTVVSGNCGVGFAPCRPGDHEKLIAVMEGVEDVPEIVMAEGIPWNWESFPEYLDVLSARNYDINIAVQIPHSPLRVFVMGDRGVRGEASTEADRVQMAALVTEAIQHGATGVSTSRSLNHRAKGGRLAPSVASAKEEVLALARGLGAANAGVFQLITETSEPAADEMALIERIAEVSKRPVSFTLAQLPENPNLWREMIAGVERANAAGHRVRGQVYPRPVGILLGLDLSLNPVLTRPSYAAISGLPLAERVAIMRDPAFKTRVLEEAPMLHPQPVMNSTLGMVDRMFELGAKPDYAPKPELSLKSRAEKLGVTPISLAYDLLLKQDGQAILYLPFANFTDGNLNVVREMMEHPDTVFGLGDGGAHYGLICDSSYPTYVLTYWARDVVAEKRFSIEWAVAELSRKPAETAGLMDRGLIAVGYKADLNIIDFDKLTLHAPRPVFDLPAGGRRLTQEAEGYLATIVNGVMTLRNGENTGALPGKLLRGEGCSVNAPH
jgi:N-acyl-D-aspartate/D-glutamate deacylase